MGGTVRDGRERKEKEEGKARNGEGMNEKGEGSVEGGMEGGKSRVRRGGTRGDKKTRFVNK